jgi:signal peptidase I
MMLYQPGKQPPAPRVFSWHSFAKEWVKPLLQVLVIVLLMNLFFPRYYVEGRSMEPNFHEYDRLFTSAVTVMTHSIARGEVVVLASPVDGQLVLKRVIGLPGETVVIEDGQVYIDGVLLEEDYIEEAPRYSGTWVLGADEYFVLGDNRNHSYDSADYGPVTLDRIRGVVVFRFWPPFTLFSSP